MYVKFIFKKGESSLMKRVLLNTFPEVKGRKKHRFLLQRPSLYQYQSHIQWKVIPYLQNHGGTVNVV